ncbi:MAG: tetratricopeptide repeat protein [Pseudomonadota bacterium]
MSLLLDALKKAEAEKRKRGSAFGSREEQPSQRAAPAPAPTRQPQDKVELTLEDPTTPPIVPEAPGQRGAAEPAETARAGAENLFAAKEGRPPIRRKGLLIIAGGVLLALTAGGGYYVWKETSPPSLATIPPGGAVATAPVTPPHAPPVVAPAPPAPRAEPVMVIDPRGGERPAAPPETAASPERPPAPAARLAAETPPEPRRPEPTPIRIARGQTAATLDPSVAAAYEALRQGDLRAAEANYQAALRADPRSRDALLGLAAVAARAGNRENAERYYRAALAVNPRDPLAVAGLLGVLGSDGSSAIESRLKTMLADQPDAAFLHYALGNHYASQARWSDAQQAYFQAFRADPANPDFAFNLAVSLDQLAQNRLAAEYYRRALALAENTPAAFDRSAAAKRLRDFGQ